MNRTDRFGGKLPFLCCLIAALSIVPRIALPQVEPEQSGDRQLAAPVAYEAIALFGPDSAQAVINIHYRIGQNFFIFVRNVDESRRDEYIARGELLVELLNEQRVSVSREIRQIPLVRTTLPRETDRPADLEGAVSFLVPRGTYTVIFSVEDRESGRTFLERTRKVEARPPAFTPLDVSQPLFVQSRPVVERQDTAGTVHFIAVNRGGDVLFDGRNGIVVQMWFPSLAESLAVSWKMEGKLDGFGQRTLKLQGSDFLVYNGLLRLSTPTPPITYTLEETSLPWKAVYLPFPTEVLEPGSFKLDVEYVAGRSRQKQTKSFRVIWPFRPFSLYAPDLVIDALSHIATEEELNEMQSGSVARRAEAFMRFWKARDPDTTTAYNELMAEYYYRVDEALRRFSTPREGDGHRTDRGRIYILYGPPSKQDRLLHPGSAPTEVWTYDHLRRRFVFIDPTRTGNYVLSQTETL